MVSLKQIKPKSINMKIKENKVDIFPADPQDSHFKRDVLNIFFKKIKKKKKS